MGSFRRFLLLSRMTNVSRRLRAPLAAPGGEEWGVSGVVKFAHAYSNTLCTGLYLSFKAQNPLWINQVSRTQ